MRLFKKKVNRPVKVLNYVRLDKGLLVRDIIVPNISINSYSSKLDINQSSLEIDNWI
jgi:hypothetical protein